MIPNRLRELRKKTGLTQREVGRRIGVCDATICLAERGHEIILSTAIKLARLYGSTIEDVWSFERTPVERADQPSIPGMEGDS